MDTVGQSALKVAPRRKIPCRTGKSNLRQRRVGPPLYQLSYIPTEMYAVVVQGFLLRLLLLHGVVTSYEKNIPQHAHVWVGQRNRQHVSGL